METIYFNETICHKTFLSMFTVQWMPKQIRWQYWPIEYFNVWSTTFIRATFSCTLLFCSLFRLSFHPFFILALPIYSYVYRRLPIGFFCACKCCFIFILSFSLDIALMPSIYNIVASWLFIQVIVKPLNRWNEWNVKWENKINIATVTLENKW